MRTVLPVTQEMDCDGAHDTTLTNAKVIPEGYDVDLQRVLIASRDPRGLSLDMLSLATFLYENEEKTGPRLANRRGIYQRRIIRHAPLAAVEGARGLGPPGIATC
jgi:hypothetical protein